jgi:bifunctional DNase/RNase
MIVRDWSITISSLEVLMIPTETPRSRYALLVVPIVALASLSWLARSHPPATSQPPPGYHAAQVVDVQPIGGGDVVRLAVGDKLLNMYVGSSEGLAISLAVKGEHYQRPLSMDLMNAALGELGAEVVRVQIDSVRDTAFIGSVHLQRGAHAIVLDARPSDATALALAHHAPVYVADPVVAVAASLY